ncbi:hypothetical protein CDL15_Pgr026260 [Punica granatum]|uniref:Uncharacterized protein n=1 Tax=Punica granatum TaxID=22663 RepID=A0A218VTW0_PUNGR|nr:hypothetical protein CDL15_Pgr026260 [Punica granatum]
MFYLASGCEERVGEVFESRVTMLNAWKGARVLGCKGMHVWGARRTGGREQARGAHGQSAEVRERASWGVWRAGARL